MEQETKNPAADSSNSFLTSISISSTPSTESSSTTSTLSPSCSSSSVPVPPEVAEMERKISFFTDHLTQTHAVIRDINNQSYWIMGPNPEVFVDGRLIPNVVPQNEMVEIDIENDDEIDPPDVVQRSPRATTWITDSASHLRRIALGTGLLYGGFFSIFSILRDDTHIFNETNFGESLGFLTLLSSGATALLVANVGEGGCGDFIENRRLGMAPIRQIMNVTLTAVTGACFTRFYTWAGAEPHVAPLAGFASGSLTMCLLYTSTQSVKDTFRSIGSCISSTAQSGRRLLGLFRSQPEAIPAPTNDDLSEPLRLE